MKPVSHNTGLVNHAEIQCLQHEVHENQSSTLPDWMIGSPGEGLGENKRSNESDDKSRPNIQL